MRMYDMNDNSNNNGGSPNRLKHVVLIAVVLVAVASIAMFAKSKLTGEKTSSVPLTFREMVDNRLEEEGTVIFYEIAEAPVWEMYVLTDFDVNATASELSSWITKDTKVNVYEYDGIHIKTRGYNISLGDIV